MEYLARISEDNFQHSRQQRTSFFKVITLIIHYCPAMRYIFSNSVAKCLVELQEITIARCDVMEAIIMNEGTSSGDIITFPRLKSLELRKLQRLKSFYKKKSERHTLIDNYGILSFNLSLCSMEWYALVTFLYKKKCEIQLGAFKGHILDIYNDRDELFLEIFDIHNKLC